MENGNGSYEAEMVSDVVDIYPLNRYYFGAKDAAPGREESLSDRVQRMKANYAARGMRNCVVGVLLVELFRHPHVLLLQVRNSFFKLPGGCLRPGESEIDGLKRKLTSKLSVNDQTNEVDWQIGECLGMWWRSDFETLPYPYLRPNTERPKECTKLFLVRLPRSQQFVVPRNLKLLAIPLCQIHGNDKRLMKFSLVSNAGYTSLDTWIHCLMGLHMAGRHTVQSSLESLNYCPSSPST